MLEKIREKLLRFIGSGKDAPVLAGFSIGFYMLIFYYSKNFSLACSLQQLAFFTAYNIALPALSFFAAVKILRLTGLSKFSGNMLFTGIVGFLTFFMLQLVYAGSYFTLILSLVIIFSFLLSLWLKKYYKLLIILLFITSVFNLKPLAKVAWVALTSSRDWKKIPDNIDEIKFSVRPNIYYIQPDGYTNHDNLAGPVYNFDNRDFEAFLHKSGFKIYNDYHANYYSTLLSNSSMFSMKHHYLQEDVNMYAAREIILSDNPVLRILKNNGYKTFFLTEKPYLVMNRPEMGYDYCNIDYSALPYLKDGLDMKFNIFPDLKANMKSNGKEPCFYFLEHFSPGHINISAQDALGINAERELYLKSLKDTNTWLTEVVSHIIKHDPNALIITGADHGGYVGFEYTGQASEKTQKPELVKSIFGAHLSVRWNKSDFHEFDDSLKSPVNLFRTIFAYLAKDNIYLKNAEDNSSYIRLNLPLGYYKYIDNSGQVVFEKMTNVQD